jgi:hypothetical protein
VLVVRKKWEQVISIFLSLSWIEHMPPKRTYNGNFLEDMR